MAKYCSECGKELSDASSKFCPDCGAQINKNVKPVDEVFKRRHSRRGLRLAATFGIIIFIVAGVAYVFVSVLDLDSFIGPMGISGAGCTGFDNSVSDINNGILSSTRLTFMDDGGNIWALNFLNDNCQGTVG